MKYLTHGFKRSGTRNCTRVVTIIPRMWSLTALIYSSFRESREPTRAKLPLRATMEYAKSKQPTLHSGLKTLEPNSPNTSPKLTPIFEVQGLQLRDNCLIHRGHIPMQVLVNSSTNQTRRGFGNFRPPHSLGEIARHNMRDLEELQNI